MDQSTRLLPRSHRLAPQILVGVSAAGALFLLWGVAGLQVWPTLFGMAVVYLGTLCFLDRMVWIYEDSRRGFQPEGP